ncbi:tautomerase family protein [Streptomyces huiliensis]|uniref:tautomerase family protein n=1 Tax=Streptomyces huiliensis TaxID=2876027 RepID=UPI001CBF36F8|nr:tautomerase family protein [Streptomyces huiliensis]MBZ4320914.1 tautomerase family protein [Streptomyces huiliensis]
MPLIQVSLYEDRLTPETRRALIGELTEAAVRALGPECRDVTWVTLQGIPRDQWGIGGTPG